MRKIKSECERQENLERVMKVNERRKSDEYAIASVVVLIRFNDALGEWP